MCANVLCGPKATCDSGKCICPPGYTGNPDDKKTGCELRGQCQNDLNCGSGEICFQIGKGVRKCVDACMHVQCGPNALCVADNHHSSCICADGFVGNPGDLIVGCQQNILVPKAQCDANEDCPSGQICSINFDGTHFCVDPCLNVACAINEICKLDDIGQPVCHCRGSFVWNPVTSACEKPSLPDCTSDSDCQPTAACHPDALGVLKCSHVCTAFTCPANSECIATLHKGRCECLPGFIGNPNDRSGCRPALRNQCTIDAQCSEREICREDHGTGTFSCVPACDLVSCGPHALCVANNHVAQCRCPPGPYAGDPNDIKSGCRSVPCVYNIDCPPSQLCNRLTHTCYDVCEEDSCGENAVCIAEDHRAVCQCPSGFRGNPEIECTPSSVCSPNPCHPSAVCDVAPGGGYSCRCPPNHIGDPATTGCRPVGNCPGGDKDCPLHSVCQGGKCINPCEGACGPNTLCNVDDRKPVCSCPPKFEAGPYGPVGGCVRSPTICNSDSDCLGDICHNGQCKGNYEKKIIFIL